MERKLILSVCCAGIMSLSACGQSTGTQNQLKVNNYKDSLTVKASGVECSARISIDYPEGGNPILLNNIREWMLGETGGTEATDINNAGALAKEYINGSMKELKEMANDMGGNGGSMPLAYSLDITKIYEGDKFVTFNAANYMYTGGAHGSYFTRSTTFRKSDGKIFGTDMLDMSKQTAIREIIEKRLLPLFEVRTAAQLHEILFLPEGETLVPLPSTPPYIDNGDMVFVYQQYEIAPYAAGSPEVRIPINTLMPYLSASFKKAYF